MLKKRPEHPGGGLLCPLRYFIITMPWILAMIPISLINAVTCSEARVTVFDSTF